MSNLRLLTAFFLLVALLASTWILAGLRLVDPAPTDRIAYVDDRGVIRTIREDGSGAITVSPDVEGFFTWPTWSSDSRRLAYSGVIGSGEDIRMSLFVSSSNGGNSTEIFAGQAGVTGLLAQGVIHFPLWSPNGNRVAFIATTMSGLTLFLDDLSPDPGAIHLLDNGPLWISWSPDSQYLLAHRADEYFLINAEGDLAIEPLGIADQESRVPAWSPDGTLFLTAQRAGRGQYHILGSRISGGKAEAPRRMLTTTPVPAYLWSPDGAHLSIAHSSRPFVYRNMRMALYGGISVYADPESEPIYVVRDPTLAHFWSPDGTKVAYARLAETPGVLRWAVLDVASGERTSLVDFVPSVAQLTMFQFFDQYAYSHSLWSPDSDALVFAGNLNTDAITASLRESGAGPRIDGPAFQHDGAHIIVVSISDEITTQVITEGFMATWSPN